MHLEISRSDLATRRLVDDSAPTAAAAGQVVMSVDSFALTANNISYALSGDMLDYWGFFPTDQGWGRLPTMGFGTVTHSRVDGVSEGERFFGFFPAGDHHVVDAEPARNGFIDVGAHRQRHARTYKAFERAGSVTDPDHDARLLLLRGLFVTSFLCDDFLADNHMFGATQAVITSASSKTSLALAHEMRRNRDVRVVGLTSAANLDFVVATGLYDEVVDYGYVETIDNDATSVIVDMAGNASVLAGLHRHLGRSLAHSCRVGATHWSESGDTGDMPGPTPAFFFAPSQIAKRGVDWGREALETRLADGLAGFIDDSRRWLSLETARGGEGLLSVYDSLVAGTVPPAAGNIIAP